MQAIPEDNQIPSTAGASTKTQRTYSCQCPKFCKGVPTERPKATFYRHLKIWKGGAAFARLSSSTIPSKRRFEIDEGPGDLDDSAIDGEFVINSKQKYPS